MPMSFICESIFSPVPFLCLEMVHYLTVNMSSFVLMSTRLELPIKKSYNNTSTVKKHQKIP